jgi:hypothetical protein
VPINAEVARYQPNHTSTASNLEGSNERAARQNEAAEAEPTQGVGVRESVPANIAVEEENSVETKEVIGIEKPVNEENPIETEIDANGNIQTQHEMSPPFTAAALSSSIVGDDDQPRNGARSKDDDTHDTSVPTGDIELHTFQEDPQQRNTSDAADRDVVSIDTLIVNPAKVDSVPVVTADDAVISSDETTPQSFNSAIHSSATSSESFDSVESFDNNLDSTTTNLSSEINGSVEATVEANGSVETAEAAMLGSW